MDPQNIFLSSYWADTLNINVKDNNDPFDGDDNIQNRMTDTIQLGAVNDGDDGKEEEDP